MGLTIKHCHKIWEALTGNLMKSDEILAGCAKLHRAKEHTYTRLVVNCLLWVSFHYSVLHVFSNDSSSRILIKLRVSSWKVIVIELSFSLGLQHWVYNIPFLWCLEKGQLKLIWGRVSTSNLEVSFLGLR